MGKVLSIYVGKVRGIEKTRVDSVKIIEGWGLEGDAHGGGWDRQVSISPIEALEQVPADKKGEVLQGGFSENFVISGIPLEDLAVNKILKIGEARIKIIYIGKEELKEHGRNYIVSREGRFGKVVRGGRVNNGDDVQLVTEQ
ncbi:MOSC domain-containing protein [Dehalobacter restrictus]|jgi:MOSC domain-containing protein YiiM|uniref:MOSC domain-containing protein n=1 Tax=Dehalobacter restrictus TaxID=55583 RepID=UPI00338EB289